MKIYTWYTFTAYSGFYLFGPESLGGRGNLFPKVEEETKTGKPFNVAATEVSRDSGMSNLVDAHDSPSR